MLQPGELEDAPPLPLQLSAIRIPNIAPKLLVRRAGPIKRNRRSAPAVVPRAVVDGKGERHVCAMAALFLRRYRVPSVASPALLLVIVGRP